MTKTITILIFIGLITGAIIFCWGTYNPQNEPQSQNYHQPQPTASSVYGCPGCPDNFMDFATDMCSRCGPTYTVSDGQNTLKCSEIVGET